MMHITQALYQAPFEAPLDRINRELRLARRELNNGNANAADADIVEAIDQLERLRALLRKGLPNPIGDGDPVRVWGER